MSRAYRIQVSQGLDRVVRGQDSVSTQLEVIEVLPGEQMADLIGRELEGRGFQRDGESLTRTADGVTTRVEPKTGTVTVTAEGTRKAVVVASAEGRAYDDAGPHASVVKESLNKAVQQDLERKIAEREAALQKEVTDRLERALCDVRLELDGAVNRATAEALKIKAGQLGTIKEIAEDRESGSLTIVVEV
jgi:hypothetical protein